MIKEVIFDCFGVLTQDGWTAVLKKYATDDTRQELSDINTAVDRGIISFDEFLANVSFITGADRNELLTMLVESYYPEDEVFDFIRELKHGYKIGLVSNISAPVESYLPLAPMELFDEQTLSYKVGVSKPDSRIFQIHLAKTGTKAEEAVFIDDREPNVAAAEAVGLHGVWYQNVDQLQKELAKLGVKI